MQLNRISVLAVIAAITLVSVARAEDEHRELDAHAHGHGTLNIVLEGKRVSMDLEAPGMDLVGFEYQAQTEEQKAAIKRVKNRLARPLALFKLPASAGCSASNVKVELEGGDDRDDGGKDNADAHDDEDDGSAGHTEFHVTYVLDCASPANLTSITFDYFKSFAGAEELTVNVVSAKAQNTYEVSRQKPTLDLGGIM